MSVVYQYQEPASSLPPAPSKKKFIFLIALAFAVIATIIVVVVFASRRNVVQTTTSPEAASPAEVLQNASQALDSITSKNFIAFKSAVHSASPSSEMNQAQFEQFSKIGEAFSECRVDTSDETTLTFNNTENPDEASIALKCDGNGKGAITMRLDTGNIWKFYLLG